MTDQPAKKPTIAQQMWLEAQPWYEEAEHAADLDNADQLWATLIPVLLEQQTAIERVTTVLHDVPYEHAKRILAALDQQEQS